MWMGLRGGGGRDREGDVGEYGNEDGNMGRGWGKGDWGWGVGSGKWEGRRRLKC